MGSAKSRFKVMTLTDAAAARALEMMANADRREAMLRVGVKNGGCAGMSYTMDWTDSVDPRDELIEDKGVRIVIDPKAVLRAPCLIGKGCRIAAGAQIGPYTVIGDRAVISSRANLKNCILFDNVTVGQNVHLSNCILGANGHVKENITVYEAAVLNIRE